jgi:hypothetical protein
MIYVKFSFILFLDREELELESRPSSQAIRRQGPFWGPISGIFHDRARIPDCPLILWFSDSRNSVCTCLYVISWSWFWIRFRSISGKVQEIVLSFTVKRSKTGFLLGFLVSITIFFSTVTHQSTTDQRRARFLLKSSNFLSISLRFPGFPSGLVI